MNFLIKPEAKIMPNANMDKEQIAVATEFVDELLELGIVGKIAEGLLVLCNAPMFVMPKEV